MSYTITYFYTQNIHVLLKFNLSYQFTEVFHNYLLCMYVIVTGY